MPKYKHGFVISTGDNYVVREQIVDGELRLYVHRRENGKEMLPLGYMLGHNALFYKLS